MAKLIAILNQKGGAGKTTISTNVASQLHADGHKVLLVDLDPQGSATDWSEQAEEGSEAVPVIRMGKNLHRDIHKVASGYEYVIVDGAPQVADLAATAVRAADLVLIPCQPSPYDVWACEPLVEVIKARQEVTDGLPKSAFIISRAIKRTKLEGEVKSSLDYYGLGLLKNGTTQRVDYANTAKNGSAVVHLDEDNQARHEIKMLTREILEYLHA
ncbi:AAA family ATPase [Vibrio parahaemolyticus]|uniref:Gp38 protein n=11 Tax=root TaxID=1 RepID=D4HTX7_9CAUD|nr:ParA family partition ATPase [Vibrio parahaemolyticus]YP_009167745.1 ParA-like partition protein [Vibrio phage VP585]EHM1247572.1 AAA family ATPase [Salmonella enterica]ELH9589400.1 AAA family ATPase [Vibrio cholerae]EJG1871593.1 AAA family ATPase [Vibrio parahaemolyticus]KOH03611.1 peptide transporter [Vibrio parahaemolyticus]MCG6424336.1 AAA family ATPase [Vibrio parahaemolyticus]